MHVGGEQISLHPVLCNVSQWLSIIEFFHLTIIILEHNPIVREGRGITY